MDILIVGFCLLGYCFALTKYARLSIETTPFLTLSSIIVILYCFAYFHFLYWGAYLILIGGGILMFNCFFIMAKEKNNLFTKYLTAGFVVSLGFALFLSILSIGLHVNGWDEFTHWGPLAKLIVINHGFVSATNIVDHKDYPPGGTLFYYLFYSLGGFSETKTFIAQQLLLLSPIPIIIQRTRWKNWPLAFLGFSFILLLLKMQVNIRIGLDGSLYMDPIVGMFLGGILIYYRFSSKQTADILRLIPPVLALMIFKLQLFPLILLITGIIFIDQLIDGVFTYHGCAALRISKHKLIVLGRIASIIALPFSAILIQYSWQQYIISIGTTLEWQAHFLTISKILPVFTGIGLSSIQQLTLAHFKIRLFNGPLHNIILFSILALTTYLLSKNSKQKREILIDNILLCLGFCAYLFGLLLMYLYDYGSYEGPILIAFPRYISIYYTAWWVVLYTGLYLTITKLRFAQNRKLHWTLISIVLMALCFLIFSHYHRMQRPNEIRKNRWTFRQEIQQITNKVKQIVKPNENVFTVWQNSGGFEKTIIVYELIPRRINLTVSSFGTHYKPHDFWTADLSLQQFISRFQSYDYLLLAYTDKNFWQHYRGIFPPQIKPLTQYTVCIGTGFEPMRARDCHPTKENAYLFKIIHKNNKIVLKNVI